MLEKSLGKELRLLEGNAGAVSYQAQNWKVDGSAL